MSDTGTRDYRDLNDLRDAMWRGVMEGGGRDILEVCADAALEWAEERYGREQWVQQQVYEQALELLGKSEARWKSQRETIMHLLSQERRDEARIAETAAIAGAARDLVKLWRSTRSGDHLAHMAPECQALACAVDASDAAPPPSAYTPALDAVTELAGVVEAAQKLANYIEKFGSFSRMDSPQRDLEAQLVDALAALERQQGEGGGDG